LLFAGLLVFYFWISFVSDRSETWLEWSDEILAYFPMLLGPGTFWLLASICTTDMNFVLPKRPVAYTYSSSSDSGFGSESILSYIPVACLVFKTGWKTDIFG